MKFRIKNVDKEFNISENSVNLLLIENSIVYRNLIMSFNSYNKDMDLIIFYEGIEILNLNNIVECILDFDFIDINRTTILKKFYKKLEKNSNTYYREEVLKLRDAINKFVFDISNDVVLDTITGEEFNLSKIFESVDLSVYYDKDDIVDIICKYMDFINEVENKSIFIFSSFRMMLTKKELDFIYEYANQKKYSIIMLERVLLYDVLHNEDLFILDEDLCEIF